MKKYIQILCVLLPLLELTGKVLAQDSTLHPYVGASGNFLGISDAGWGIEIGLRYKNYYLGLEYGNYSSGDYTESDGTMVFPTDGIEYNYYNGDPHLATTREHYFSMDGGVIITNTFWLGLSALVSEQTIIHPVKQTDGFFRWTTLHDVWFDIGPDIRIEGWNHMLINFSYSHRRGIKSGLAYIM